MSKTIKELADCCLPVLFNTQLEDIDYSICGSSFLIKYYERMFVLTAKHVIKDYDPDCVLIPYRLGSRDFLPFRKKHEIIEKLDNDNDYADIIMFEIEDKSLLDENLYPIDFKTFTYRKLLKGDELIFFGYPNDLSEINYETFHINATIYQRDGVYQGPSPSKHCNIIKFGELDRVNNINGLSGGPVFHLESCTLVGMLIRGTKESRLGHFIDSKIIYNLLKKLVK